MDAERATAPPTAPAARHRCLLSADAMPEALPGPPRRGRVFFISGSPTSVGHVYRVEHAIAALIATGWQASWLPARDPEAAARAGESDLVVVFRAAWSEALAAVAAGCRQRCVPMVYDVDDLIFEPGLMTDGSIAVLAAMSDHDRQVFAAAAANHRTMLQRATAAILSTRPLADAAAVHCRRTFVLPNALDPRMEAAAAAARVAPRKPSTSDGRPRLMFASGTPSHDRDFTVAAEAIARLFARRPEPILVLLGHIDPASQPCLEPFADRIECRPVVPFPELFAEVARCDVNLAPLELGNPFCAAKSAVRCLVASMVEVPSVVSPTPPLREAVTEGRTGLVASDVAAWERALEQLITDPAGRLRMGREARVATAARSGFAAWAPLVDKVYTRIAAGGP
jgi:glycosyltransferase involved in cell wall biosynthesis